MSCLIMEWYDWGMSASNNNTFTELDGIDVNFASESLHPCLNGHAASQSGVTFQVCHWAVQNQIFVFVVSVCLLMHPLEPVILEDHSASPANRSLCIIVMRTQVRTIGEVIPVAVAFIKGMHLHASDSVKQGLSHKSGHCFNDPVFVFYVDIDAALIGRYVISWTLGNLVGTCSWWTEKNLKLLLRAVWKSLPSEPLSIIATNYYLLPCKQLQ